MKTMQIPLPRSAQEFSTWTWPQIEPFLRELAERPLTAQNLEEWLTDWSHLLSLLKETDARLLVAVSVDTSDAGAEARYIDF
jgi:hypothetical protein